DVFSHGYICPKGAALRELHSDPDRLRKPLVKRNGHFVEVTWREAFGEIERRLPPILKQHGRDSVAMVAGNPAAHSFGLLLYIPRLARAIGTKNIFTAATVDQMPKQVSAGLMFGHWLSIPVPDIERTDLLLMLGANPMVSNGSLWSVPDFRGKAKALRGRGGRLIVVDPRRTETAEIADRHLFIRPGTDAFFLLGIVHTLFEEHLVRLGRIAEHLAGVDLLEPAVAEYTPERIAKRCGIGAAAIRETAREVATAKHAAVYGRIGTCLQEFGTLTSWLIDVINVLTGNLDEPGGAMFAKPPAFAANAAGKPGAGRGVIMGRRTSRVAGAPEVMGELPISCLAEEIDTPGEGQIKALIAVAGNPVLSSPNGPHLSAALDQLDFMVSLDIYLNETSRHADVILPGGSPLEESHYDIGLSQFAYRNYARYSPPVLPRDPERPPEWQNLLRLTAIIEGKGADIDIDKLDDELTAEDIRSRVPAPQADAVIEMTSRWHGPDRQLDLALRRGPYGDNFGLNPAGLNLSTLVASPDGIDLGALSPRVPEMIRTPSGKIEVAPAQLLDDLKRIAADLARPAPELVIVGRRDLRSNNSWMHNLPKLARGAYRCTALVNPQDAHRLGLRDGGLARIANGERVIEAQVEISDEMMPGVVSLPHGWGHDEPGARMKIAAERPGANLNALFDDAWRDPLSGNSVASGVPIRMSPIASA
ncbi:MAG TPA: molybdopterin-dependent oxidoreductase, partial [Candidatus Binataceae bacterium]|nr:molybdopterin-dependent oxidoreductase [Candidatus Binataceae bacterium]